MDRVSFLYIWTNRQIYALQPCIYLATSRRGKKIDKREIETEREEEEEEKAQEYEYIAINLLFCRHDDIVHSSSLFEWYCLSFPLSFFLVQYKF